MATRRDVLIAGAAAGGALLAGASHVFADTYDLVIKGGRVIDPSPRRYVGMRISPCRPVAGGRSPPGGGAPRADVPRRSLQHSRADHRAPAGPH